MELESLTCNHCGAPIEVPASANYITCTHCGSQLKVHRGDSATFTEVVKELGETAQDLAEQVSRLTKQNALAALDRQWQLKREMFMVTDKNGVKHLPHETSAVISGVVVSVFGICWTAVAISIVAAAPSFGPFRVTGFVFPAIGLLFIIFGVFVAVRNYTKAQQYRVAYRRYQQSRQRLIHDENRRLAERGSDEA